ncbi:neuronal acetylcholine receptor subunit beta-4-like [Haliotis rufescens]|uniref:neuronal acetylcholine receptor subunit beta-4-like n=1 Tax=Haliotis rufescens TaxID=6454 RepID=UPI00201EF03E|nr:neuronal acetylcholine receptor subunit beta-4-like [Haliotis rufescens]
MFFKSARTLSLLIAIFGACISNTTQSTLRRLKTYLQGHTATAGITVQLQVDKQVNISLLPMSISNLNAAEQTFTFSAGVSMKWFDHNLAWNKTEYDDIENVTISAAYVWTPSLIIPNGVDNVVPGSVLSPEIQSRGKAKQLIVESFKTSCQIDITLYPFDQQRCSILFMPVNSFKPGIYATGSIMDTLPTFFIENSEWELVDTHAKVIDPQMIYISRVASFEFLLKRKSMFYIVSIIFPMALLSLLNACVFLLPADSGEKMSYLISIFVSYAVFMNFVNDSIPKSGDVCRLSVYLTLILCQSCLTIITTMATLNVRNNGLLFQTKTDVQPAKDNANTTSTQRTIVKSASNVRRADYVLFGMFLLLALMSLLVFCV